MDLIMRIHGIDLRPFAVDSIDMTIDSIRDSMVAVDCCRRHSYLNKCE